MQTLQTRGHGLSRRLALICGLTSGWAGVARARPHLNRPAPDFTLRLMRGDIVRLGDLRGQVVVLNVWASWCLPCRAEMPALDACVRDYGDRGLVVLGVSHDGPESHEAARRIASQHSFDSAFESESDLSGYGRIWQVPLSFVIDREGILRLDGGSQPVLMDPDRLRRWVLPLL